MVQVKRASELGLSGANKHIRHACIDCGKERWVVLLRGKPISLRCYSCAKLRERHPKWQGGRFKTQDGYIRILMPEHPHANMLGYILEHRIIMERVLGRYLLPAEIPHHINGIKDDNRPENLLLLANQAEHRREHARR